MDTLEPLINAILVHENIRPAMLVQPADYGEARETDPKMASILHQLKSYFPELIHSSHYEIYQGTLISKKNYNGKLINLMEMGKILGYPCYKDFEMNRNEITYSASIVINMDGVDHEVITNLCKTKEKQREFERLATHIQRALLGYTDLVGVVQSVRVKITTIIPTTVLIHKLIHDLHFTKEDLDAVNNVMFNFGFNVDFQFFFTDNFQYKNKIHRGLLISLLLMEKNYTLSPFFPLQEYPEQNKTVLEIIHAWELEFMDVIGKTKITGTTVHPEIACRKLGRDFNPNTQRCDRKCNSGQTRRKYDFKCVHTPTSLYEKIKFWYKNF
jgi:hypothetical protein